MDHRVNSRARHGLMLGVLGAGVLLGSLQPAPLMAQSDDAAAPAPASAAPLHAVPPARHRRTSRTRSAAERGDAPSPSPRADSPTDTAAPAAGAADSSAAASKTTGSADDLESQPFSGYERSRSAAPVEDSGSLALGVVGKLGLVVALMLAGAAGWKRFRGVAAPKNLPSGQGLQVMSTVALGPQRFLHLVNAGHHQLVVGSSAQSVSLIAILEGEGSRMAAMPASGHPASAAIAAPGGRFAPAVSMAGANTEPTAEDFEELLLRLREVETGAAAGYSPAEGRDPAGQSREPGAPRRSAPGAPGSRSPSARSSEPVPARGESYAGAAPSRAERRRAASDEWPVADDDGRSPRSAPSSPSAAEETPAPVAAGAGGRFAGGYGGAGTEQDPERALAPGSLFRTSRAPAAADPDA